MHEADVGAPGNVSDPIGVATQSRWLVLALVFKLPQLHFIVVSAGDESLGRGLELSCSCRRVLLCENGGLGGRTPANSINSALVRDKVLRLDPLVVGCARQDHQSTLCCSCRQD